LYEAATLAMAEFQRCRFTENASGVATRVTVVGYFESPEA
jgi:hypothetical protein